MPNLDVRITKGGDVTEVEWNGAKYTKVDRNAQVGDLIRFTSFAVDEAAKNVTVGAFYEVDEIDRFGDPHIIDDAGDNYDTGGDDFEVFAKVDEPTIEWADSAEEQKPRFKVGDIAEVAANNSGHAFDVGEKVRIVRIDDYDDDLPYHVKSIKDDFELWVSAEDLKPTTNAENQPETTTFEVATKPGGLHVFRAEGESNPEDFVKAHITLIYGKAFFSHPTVFIPLDDIESVTKREAASN